MYYIKLFLYNVYYYASKYWYLILLAAALIAFIIVEARRGFARTKESIRKFLVSLKRNPQTIPLVVLLVTFVIYSFNLTKMSNTTALVQGRGMGLCQFVLMLFTLLALVCMLNAFPRRKKANIPMIVLMYAMFAVNVYCSIHYQNCIMAAITREVSPIDLMANPFIAQANNMLNTYIVLVVVTAALVALMPVYSKLLKKINTSVSIEDNGDMDEIELTE